MQTNYLAMIWVLLVTNTVDVPLTPSGDEYLRQQIVQQQHVYELPAFPFPGFFPVTNLVVVRTNLIRRKMVWLETPVESGVLSLESKVGESRPSGGSDPRRQTSDFRLLPLHPGGIEGFPMPPLPPGVTGAKAQGSVHDTPHLTPDTGPP